MVTASGTPLFDSQGFPLHGKLQASLAELMLQQYMTSSPDNSSLIATDQPLSLHSS